MVILVIVFSVRVYVGEREREKPIMSHNIEVVYSQPREGEVSSDREVKSVF